MKILIQAGLVPQGQDVMKATGSTPYQIRDSYTIYGNPNQKIQAEKGIRFLCSSSSANAISSDTEVKMVFDDIEEAINFLEYLIDGDSQ